MEEKRHEMILENTHSSGAEEWYCPSCGRRMTITWHPWKKIILEQGDIYAAHSASKGGLRIGSINVSESNERDRQSSLDTLTEDRYLTPWIQWLKNVDLDDWGNKED